MGFRTSISRCFWSLVFAIIVLGTLPATPTRAQEVASLPAMALGQSGLPLPRFVSLKAGKVNLRIGPGLNYPVEWMYLKSGMPMEIIQEYDNWRRVRDADGAEGWINQSLLSGRRTAIVAPWRRGEDLTLMVRAEASDHARVAVKLEPGVIGNLHACNGEWCEMDFDGHRGWIRQTQLWGAYPGETYKE